MSLENAAEDDIDTEALQAQIDLSMSFAQDMINSWMEPHKLATRSRRKDLEQELTEYMKRPPRLGVGASIPEGHQSMSRETARLKGKLSGSKRAREEDEVAPPKSISEDEGESRAGAIKKKARSDPFDVVHGRKKQKHKDADTTEPQAVLATSSSLAPDDSETEEVLNALLPNGTSHIEESPLKKKKKQKHKDHPQPEMPGSPHVPASVDRHSSPRNIVEVQAGPPSTPTRQVQPKIEIPDEAIDVSLFQTPVLNHLSPRKPLPVDLLKTPLLNLAGPPHSDHESDADPADSPSASPKKKRKRRKKKKRLVTEANGDTNPQTMDNVAS